jgi:hypothetical protein
MGEIIDRDKHTFHGPYEMYNVWKAIFSGTKEMTPTEKFMGLRRISP